MKKLFRYFLLILIISCFTISCHCKIDSKPELIDFNSSECQEGSNSTNLYRLVNRIQDIKIENEFKTYEIFVVANCSRASNGGIEMKNDTLNLKYEGIPIITESRETEEHIIVESVVVESDCDCGFVLTYKIKGLPTKDYVVVANGETISQTPHKYRIVRDKPKFDVVNNDTINLIDIYGLKQGLHIFNLQDGRLYRKINFIDNEMTTGLASVGYNFEGFDMVETYMKDKNYTKRKYYNRGVLIKECDTDGTFDEGTNCEYFE